MGKDKHKDKIPPKDLWTTAKVLIKIYKSGSCVPRR
jgi:hypothetical protein